MSQQRSPMSALTRWVLGHRKLVVALWVALAAAGVMAIGPADRAFEQGLPPDIISSDLQQYSALGPAFSLAHVMSILMKQGMSVPAIVKAVTDAPARALHIQDRAGSLAPGRPADITVSRIERGRFDLADTQGVVRTAGERFVPVMAFKNGVRHDSDLTRCQDERNWVLQIVEDHVPAAARSLTPRQIAFLASLREALLAVDWTYDLKNLDLARAHALRAVFDVVRAKHDVDDVIERRRKT